MVRGDDERAALRQLALNLPPHDRPAQREGDRREEPEDRRPTLFWRKTFLRRSPLLSGHPYASTVKSAPRVSSFAMKFS
ncbi:hypothetical protein ACFPRL_08775 [Pseudoclavibacter helvolus]